MAMQASRLRLVSHCCSAATGSIRQSHLAHPQRRLLSTTSLDVNFAERKQPLTTSTPHGLRYALPVSAAPQPSSFQAPAFQDEPPHPHQYYNTYIRNSEFVPAAALTELTCTATSRAYSPQHFYQSRILEQFVSQPVNTITLRQLCFFGRNMTEEKLIRSANYVRTELSIRLAHRIRDFQYLPFIVGTNPHIERVYDLYWQAFDRFRRFPQIETMEDNDRFCEMVRGILEQHLVVIPQLALGIVECAQHIQPVQADRFMNTMLRSRISRRVIAEQHLALTHNYHSPLHWEEERGYIGMVYTHCGSREIVEKCARLARVYCESNYGPGQPEGWEPPKVIIDGNPDVFFTYIPDHLEYIIYELLKNSLTYTILRYAPPPGSTSATVSIPLPPVIVTTCSGPTDLIFRVSDQAGGIPPSRYTSLWSYSQAPNFANFDKVPRMAASMAEHEDGTIIPPSLRLGIGLPMSKVYAEYWGGELNVMTMDGFGTDAYVRIPKLGNKMENLDFKEYEATTDPSYGSIPKEGPAGAGWVPKVVSAMNAGGSDSTA
ncbi:hypothetical protein BC937DRAFT_95381 [Endogone sp. FLAS-F59071]|nr:hypothetical protein BC937DRAFT_95381 [Endogone sp. FLAS-F59071]|eukprot:RUS13404.1 hypothetical protein BC937DRAFT_95381 [Endogone sp. FLAS-F59071]